MFASEGTKLVSPNRTPAECIARSRSLSLSFFSLPEVILFVENILLSVSLARQSLAFKTEIQYANYRPLYPNRIERGRFLCSAWTLRPRAKFSFSIESRGCFPRAISARRDLERSPADRQLNGNNAEIESAWTTTSFFSGVFVD